MGGYSPYSSVSTADLTSQAIQVGMSGALPGPVNLASADAPWYGPDDDFPKGVPKDADFLEGVNGGAGARYGSSDLTAQLKVLQSGDSSQLRALAKSLGISNSTAPMGTGGYADIRQALP